MAEALKATAIYTNKKETFTMKASFYNFKSNCVFI